MTTVEERTAFAKLEALKEIRGKTISLEKIRMRILHDLESYEGEEKCLAEYRKELELLQQEKMAHVEELRQIHSDINSMETVMKQAEEAKRNAQSSARALLDEYRPLKHDVDLMRTELLGIEKLPDLPQSDKERMGSIGLLDKPKNPLDQWHAHAAQVAAAHHHQQLAAAVHAAASAAAGGEEKSFAASLASIHAGARGGGGAPGSGHGPPSGPPPPSNNPFLAAAAA